MAACCREFATEFFLSLGPDAVASFLSCCIENIESLKGSGLDGLKRRGHFLGIEDEISKRYCQPFAQGGIVIGLNFTVDLFVSGESLLGLLD